MVKEEKPKRKRAAPRKKPVRVVERKVENRIVHKPCGSISSTEHTGHIPPTFTSLSSILPSQHDPEVILQLFHFQSNHCKQVLAKSSRFISPRKELSVNHVHRAMHTVNDHLIVKSRPNLANIASRINVTKLSVDFPGPEGILRLQNDALLLPSFDTLIN